MKVLLLEPHDCFQCGACRTDFCAPKTYRHGIDNSSGVLMSGTTDSQKNFKNSEVKWEMQVNILRK